MKKHLKQKHLKIILIVLLLFLVIYFAKFSSISDQLTLGNIQNNSQKLTDFVDAHYLGAIIFFVILYVLVVALSIPGATVLTLTSGFLFGTILGALYVNIGATLGAVFAFLSARYLFGKTLNKKYTKQLEKFNNECQINGHNYLLTLRFIPLFPFFLINIIAGLTKIPLRTFLWTTIIGILPGSLVYTYTGKQLATIKSIGDILSFNVLLAFVLLGVFALVPVIYKKLKKKECSVESKS